ncbi:MAG: hypothetical protein COX19_09565 [Desulfobacterales bacterium CG23_combo_of_CG06-09_8_20_14_all_51_8]|nr:MAG: hypothetical protein COX19_09565 [Desulfobacterales bacterium CG23_combo_of_CG06-09_8_20_14_all_51_8]
MKFRLWFAVVLCGVVMSCLLMVSCGEKKQGKVIVTEQEFVLRRDSDKAYVMDARGKVKNVGQADVKNVVVTGYCRSCGELINPGNWFVSDIEKTPDQKDTINYLPVNAEEEFSFKGVAFIYNMVPEEPAAIPEKMEVVVESFESVN